MGLVCFPVFMIKVQIFMCNCVCRSESGTFRDGDLLVNRDGVRIVSQSEVEAV